MTATQREGLSDAALALTQPVIDELLKDIARRIKDAGAITDTAEYQIYRAQALGESKQAIKAAVARQIKAQDKVIDSLFDYILDNSTPLTANGSLKQIAEGYAKMSRQKTAEQLKNLWADTPQGKVLPIQDAYAKALDFAFRQTVTGALDTETAIRRACAPLAKRGLRTIEQKSGRSVGIEYADEIAAYEEERRMRRSYYEKVENRANGLQEEEPDPLSPARAAIATAMQAAKVSEATGAPLPKPLTWKRGFYDTTRTFPSGWYECPVCGCRADWEPEQCPKCYTRLEPEETEG